MKVLLITGSYPPMKCGVGDYSYHLAKSLSADPETRVAVLTSTAAGSSSDSDAIEVFPVMKSWTVADAFKVIAIIRQWSPDVVHIQQPTQGYGKGQLPWLLPLIGFLLGKKMVETWHGAYGLEHAPKLLLKAIVPGSLIFVHPDFIEKFNPYLRWVFWNKRCTFIKNASAIPKSLLNRDELLALRSRYVVHRKRLVVFFGFVYPHKGVELLFEIANPETDQLLIAGEIDGNSDYGRRILALADSEPWRGKVTITGFLDVADAAAVLAAADAVVLPFRSGGGEWNTSIHGAVMQGTFVVTTSLSRSGYDAANNVYYAAPDNPDELRTALDRYAGVRNEVSACDNEWEQIAAAHRAVYHV